MPGPGPTSRIGHRRLRVSDADRRGPASRAHRPHDQRPPRVAVPDVVEGVEGRQLHADAARAENGGNGIDAIQQQPHPVLHRSAIDRAGTGPANSRWRHSSSAPSKFAFAGQRAFGRVAEIAHDADDFGGEPCRGATKRARSAGVTASPWAVGLKGLAGRSSSGWSDDGEMRPTCQSLRKSVRPAHARRR